LSDALGNSYAWRADEMLSWSNGTSYSYNAEGERAGKSGPAPTDTVYFTGRPIARYAGVWTDLVYGAGGMLAEVPQGGAPAYRMTDHLGSAVGTLSPTGGLIGGIQDYAPYGELFNGSATADPYKFTGKERDSESGNDYFGARYFDSNIGRFLSPDWSAKVEPVPYSKLDNPQSLNLYAYVGNNPVSLVDADGHAPMSWGGFEDCSERHDCNGGGQAQAEVQANQAAQAAERAQQQSGQVTPSTSGTPGAPASGTPAEAVQVGHARDPNRPWGSLLYSYQIVDSNGSPVTGNNISVKENDVLTSVTGNVKVINQTSNGRFVPANNQGVFVDSVGPVHQPRATSSYDTTARQTFSVKVGKSVFRLSTVVKQQTVVVKGSVFSDSATVVNP
jgi:RHS repeat-associated protein